MDGLRLVNLRSFADTGWMDIKPLTLLVGRNSSGKSTIARFFPLMRQSVGSRTRGPLLWNGEDVDFGSLEEVRRRGAAGPVGYGVRLLKVDSVQGPVSTMVYLDGAGEIDGCEVELAGLVGRFQRGAGVDIGGATDRGLSPVLLELATSSFFPSDYRFTEGWVFQDIQKPELRELLRLHPPFLIWFVAITGVRMRVEGTVGALSYLGPFRQMPRRFYRHQNLDVSALDPMGSNLPLLLAALPPERLTALSDWLADTFGFRIAVVNVPGHVQVKVTTADGITDNLMDVGFGYTQLLPVAVQLWMHSTQPDGPPAIIVLEEPDLHLHPALQARVGAALARAAQASKGRVRLIVETHSHFLINAVGEAIGAGALASDLVSVLRVEKGTDGVSTVHPTTFDADGLLRDWPVGFFLPDADLA